MAKKKTVKKAVKKKIAKKVVLTPEQHFGEWWNKVAQKKVDKIEKRWIKENEPNDPEDDGGGDHWCVNQMMHEGEAHNMTYDIAEQVFLKGYKGEAWRYGQEDSLYCELDDVICEAYEAGKKAKK